MDYGYHLAKANGRGVPIVEQPTPEFKQAIELVIGILSDDYQRADEMLWMEQQRGAASLEKIAHLRSILTYMENLVYVLDAIVYLDHGHHLVRTVPATGEPYFDIVDGPGPQTPNEAEEYEAAVDKANRAMKALEDRQVERDDLLTAAERATDEGMPENPSGRSQAGPSFQVNNETGEIRELHGED